MGKQAKQRKARRAAGGGDDPGLLGALDLLARRRAPYRDLLAAIAGDTLRRFPIAGTPGGLRLLEIGAGTGQLRGWLPAESAARTLASDPARRALADLRRRGAGATVPVLAARAQALPIAGSALDGVLGLCVFDAIHAAGGESAAAAEIARVLAPGGRFVHLLDMATLLDTPFVKLAGAGLVPIPNVFGDPAEHAWPLDVLLLRRDWISGLLVLAARAGHPLARDFGPFFEAFLATPFDGARAVPLFQRLASDGDRRFALSSAIASACQLAVAVGYPTMQPQPLHSGRYLASVIETAFKDTGAFRVEASEIVARSAWRAATKEDGNTRYRSLALGHERVLAELPAKLLDEGAREGGAAGRVLVEAGVYVFVATRAAREEPA